MSHLMKISEAASLALHVMAFLAGRPLRMVTAKEAAARLRVSEAHLAKVLQRLAKAGLVRSTRGQKGGFTLKKPAREIPLLEIYETIEGRLEETSCLVGVPICLGEECVLGGLLKKVDDEARAYLTRTRLSDLERVFGRDNRQGQSPALAAGS